MAWSKWKSQKAALAGQVVVRTTFGANNADYDKMMMMLMINNKIGFPDCNNGTMVEAEAV